MVHRTQPSWRLQVSNTDVNYGVTSCFLFYGFLFHRPHGLWIPSVRNEGCTKASKGSSKLESGGRKQILGDREGGREACWGAQKDCCSSQLHVGENSDGWAPSQASESRITRGAALATAFFQGFPGGSSRQPGLRTTVFKQGPEWDNKQTHLKFFSNLLGGKATWRACWILWVSQTHPAPPQEDELQLVWMKLRL